MIYAISSVLRGGGVIEFFVLRLFAVDRKEVGRSKKYQESVS